MKKILLVALTILMGTVSMSAQHFFCGTSQQDQYHQLQRLKQNRINAAHQENAGQRDVDYYVPIKVHIVGLNDGTQYVSESDLIEMLCAINEAFEDQDIQFYFKFPHNYINSTPLFSDAQSGGGALQAGLNRVSDAMNIFVVGTFPSTGLQAYYAPTFPGNIRDYIVAKKTAIFDSTLAHEIGHFFTLAHPFFGWEPPNNPQQSFPGYPAPYQGWEEQWHGNPVGTFAPAYDFQESIRNERQDGGNCNIAADLICDTPPDYLFAYSPLQTGCNEWNGGAMDPQGTEVDPMENNTMSYFTGCSGFTFTNDQKTAIIADLESAQRTYIRPNYTPSLEEITAAPALVFPEDEGTTPGYNAVQFDWDPVDGAQSYFLEVDRFQNFAFNPQRFLVNGTTRIVSDVFSQTTKYYWRVRPYAEYPGCGVPFSEIRSFTTSNTVSVAQIEGVNAWSVSPNPVSSSQVLNVSIDAAQSFDAEINLYNVAGQLLKSVNNQSFAVGTTTIELETAGLNPGLYIVAIQSENGVMNQKVVVTK